MKTIVLDTSREANRGNLSQAAKLFLTKNKTVTLIVTGREKELTTLKKESRLTPFPVLKAGEEEPEDPSFFLSKAIEVANQYQAKGLLTFAPKNEIKKLAFSSFKARSLPLFVCSFLTRSPNRFCLLGDIGYQSEWKAEDYVAASKELQELVSKGFLLSHPTFSLVSSSEDPQDLPKNAFDAYEFFKTMDGFQGLTPVTKLMEGKSDFYLTDGFVGQSIVQSFASSYHLFADKYEAYKNQDFSAKMAFKMGSTMIKTIQSQTSAILDATGTLLLGYDSLILKANDEASPTGLQKSIDLLASALDTLVTE